MSAGLMVIIKFAEGSLETKTYVNSFTGGGEGWGKVMGFGSWVMAYSPQVVVVWKLLGGLGLGRR
jgi:hypothetical protein